MSFGKGSQTTIPEITPEQKAAIAAQTQFLTGTIIPNYQQAVQGAKDIYQGNQAGVLNAAQNLAGTAMQGQQALGETGESALRSGITGLQSLFNPDYEANQIQAAMMPAQMQYAQNLAGQRAGYGGAGQLGSARDILAQQQLAGSARAQAMQTAAQIQQNIAGQRAAAATNLAGLGQGGINQAIAAAQVPVSAAMTPQQLYANYANVIFGTPGGSYTPNFQGTQGSTTSGYNFSVTPQGVRDVFKFF